jgi:hypothetical protein
MTEKMYSKSIEVFKQLSKDTVCVSIRLLDVVLKT